MQALQHGCCTRAGWKVCKLAKKVLRYSSKYKHTLKEIFSDTNCIVSIKIHAHWTVTQDFEKGSIAEAVAEKKSNQNGLESPQNGATSLGKYSSHKGAA